MEALLQELFRLCGSLEPATSAEILALVGLLSLAIGFVILMSRAGDAAREGMGHVAQGVGALFMAIMRLAAAFMILWLTYCLARAALIHIQH